MSQTPISEIEDKYKKITVARILFYIISPVIVVVTFLSLYINTFNLILLALLFFLIVVGVITPEISKYDLIRFHLNKLITFLNERNPKKSEHHIDKLAYTIKELNQTANDYFIFNYNKSTLDNLWNLLKYQIYPYLKEDEDYNSYVETLEGINRAFEYESLTDLNEIVGGVVIDETERDNQNAILFPYEQPYFITRILKSSTKYFKTQFDKHIIVRAGFLIIVFSVIGYYISINFTNITFDNSLFGPILILSGAIASGWGKITNQ